MRQITRDMLQNVKRMDMNDLSETEFQILCSTFTGCIQGMFMKYFQTWNVNCSQDKSIKRSLKLHVESHNDEGLKKEPDVVFSINNSTSDGRLFCFAIEYKLKMVDEDREQLVRDMITISRHTDDQTIYGALVDINNFLFVKYNKNLNKLSMEEHAWEIDSENAESQIVYELLVCIIEKKISAWDKKYSKKQNSAK